MRVALHSVASGLKAGDVERQWLRSLAFVYLRDLVDCVAFHSVASAFKAGDAERQGLLAPAFVFSS